MFKRHILKELSSYLDNQLTEPKRQKVETHLRECKFCNEELSKLKMLSEKLKLWQAPELGSDFDSVVRNKIVLGELERNEVKMKRKTLGILIPSGVLAGILVFVFLGQFYMRSMQAGFKKTADFRVSQEQHIQNMVDAEVQSRRRMSLRGLTSQPELSYSASTKPDGDYYRKESDAISLSEQKRVITEAGGSVIVIQPSLPATGEGEKIIRTAEVRLEVQDGQEAYQKAAEICQELGGYLAASNFYKNAEGREAGTITMRIPKEKFLVALDKLSALGRVESSTSNSQDVSQEYANLKAQLDASMIVYDKMLESLQKRQTTIPEAMRLESEITPILHRIEGLKNRIEYLNNAVSYTTITVHLYEPKVSAKILKEAGKAIRESIIAAQINTVRLFVNIIRALPTLIALVIWLAIILGVVLLVKYWVNRLLKR